MRVESGTGNPGFLDPHELEILFDFLRECLQQATPMIRQERASARETVREKARERERERALAKQRGMEKRERKGSKRVRGDERQGERRRERDVRWLRERKRGER